MYEKDCKFDRNMYSVLFYKKDCWFDRNTYRVPFLWEGLLVRQEYRVPFFDKKDFRFDRNIYRVPFLWEWLLVRLEYLSCPIFWWVGLLISTGIFIVCHCLMGRNADSTHLSCLIFYGNDCWFDRNIHRVRFFYKYLVIFVITMWFVNQGVTTYICWTCSKDYRFGTDIYSVSVSKDVTINVLTVYQSKSNDIGFSVVLVRRVMGSV